MAKTPAPTASPDSSPAEKFEQFEMRAEEIAHAAEEDAAPAETPTIAASTDAITSFDVANEALRAAETESRSEPSQWASAAEQLRPFGWPQMDGLAAPAAGLQQFMTSASEYGRELFDLQMSALTALSQARSPQDVARVQLDFSQQAIQASLARMTAAARLLQSSATRS